MPTTIAIDPAVRDRLKTFGHAGMTYNEILTRMMDGVEREAFVAEMRRLAAQTKEEDWIDLEDVDWDEPRQVPARKRPRASRRSADAKKRSS